MAVYLATTRLPYLEKPPEAFLSPDPAKALECGPLPPGPESRLRGLQGVGHEGGHAFGHGTQHETFARCQVRRRRCASSGAFVIFAAQENDPFKPLVCLPPFKHSFKGAKYGHR